MAGLAGTPHQCGPRTTPVLSTGHASVAQCPMSPHELRRCAHCRRWLPLSEFYVRTTDGHPDCYCKECRRAIVRIRRKGQDLSTAHPTRLRTSTSSKSRTKSSCARPSRAKRRLLIVQTADPALRLTLILEAKQKVRESVERKRNLMKMEEYDLMKN